MSTFTGPPPIRVPPGRGRTLGPSRTAARVVHRRAWLSTGPGSRPRSGGAGRQNRAVTHLLRPPRRLRVDPLLDRDRAGRRRRRRGHRERRGPPAEVLARRSPSPSDVPAERLWAGSARWPTGSACRRPSSPTAPSSGSDGPAPGARPGTARERPGTPRRGGPDAGRALPLGQGRHVLGRGSDASVRLDDPDVSRRHVGVEVGRGAITVADSGSTNGSRLDGRALDGRRVPGRPARSSAWARAP